MAEGIKEGEGERASPAIWQIANGTKGFLTSLGLAQVQSHNVLSLPLSYPPSLSHSLSSSPPLPLTMLNLSQAYDSMSEKQGA